MRRRDFVTALLCAAALGACAELTAETPLFTPADQIGPPPLTEGVWIMLQEGCPESMIRRRVGRFPEDCAPFELSRLADGAWQARTRVDLVYGLSSQERAEAEETTGPYRMIIAPAVERVDAVAYAPIYVAEVTRSAANSNAGYMVIAPIGAKPATSALFVVSVSCADALRDGPIEGITPRYTARANEAPAPEAPSGSGSPDGEPTGTGQVLSGCVASTQRAVREAARRAVIENLDEMLEHRAAYVRPLGN